MKRLNRHPEWLLLALITIAAGALRVADLGAVRLDPFYDAAVRSMTLSWHNFFFGAFEPGGSVSIDKPPIDLWLQVASVKLFGWSSTTLKLPEALAGTCSVPLLYAAVRRPFGRRAGLAAALAMAVLPIEVITARSDTMDAVMMALLVLALLLFVKAGEDGRTIWLLAGAAALGLAFNVKLLESLVALPGLALLAYLGRPSLRSRPRHLLRLLAAGAVFVVVALSWLGATLLFPAHERPYAIGSTNGSAWNAAFVFNGLDRIEGKAVEGSGESFLAHHRYPEQTLEERTRIPIPPPAPARLLDRIGPLSGERLGLELLAALLLGLPALLIGARGSPRRRALGIGLVVWTITGVALFSDMARLHPRYVEGFTPAVAALFGIGVAWATASRERARLLTLGLALAALLLYAEHLLFGATAVWWVMLAGALAAFALALSAGQSSRGAAAVLLATLVALLAIPVQASIHSLRVKTSDAGTVGALRAGEQPQLSAYLRAHRDGAHYEFAVESATKAASLIVADAEPIVVLTSYDARTLTSVVALERLVARGEVRYAFLDALCAPHAPAHDAACSAPARWVRAHGEDVSRRAGLARGKVLWRLPGPIA